MELSYIVLNVEDPERVRAWYVEYLEMAVVSQDRNSFLLASKGGGAALEIRRGRPLDHPERLTLAFHVDEVKAVFKRLSDRKVPFLSPPTRSERGRIVARLRDPGGHTVEIFSPDLKDLQEELTIRRQLDIGDIVRRKAVR